jgi:ribosomal peptide maturation radical SAM protein 1
MKMRGIWRKGMGRKAQDKKVLLLALPWAGLMTPSIQLGTLKSYLLKNVVSVDTRHAYLRLVEQIGIDDYNFIVNTPYLGEAIYSSLLFPRNPGAKAFVKKMCKKLSAKVPLKTIKEFNRFWLRTIKWNKYDLVGFTVDCGQLMPALYFAKEIKKINPGINIVLGGFNCFKGLGISILKTFSFVDFAISGEGEATLLELIHSLAERKYSRVKGLIYRDRGEVVFNGPRESIKDLNALPFPDFSEYFESLKNHVSPPLAARIKSGLYLPMDISRGCLWNKCTFCNLNMHKPTYRQKSAGRVAEELRFLEGKYKISNFICVVNNFKYSVELFRKIKKLGKAFNIYLPYRVQRGAKGLLKSMFNAGAKKILVGLESFSTNMLLNKMNKGVTAIENLETLKWCEEIGIECASNIIYGYPNETTKDINENIKNMQYAKGFQPPAPRLFLLNYMSPVFLQPEKFGIKNLFRHSYYSLFLPDFICKSLIFDRFDFARKTRPPRLSKYFNVLNEWANLYNAKGGRPLFYYQRERDRIILKDRRNGAERTFVIRSIRKDIYLFCDCIKSFDDICNHFKKISRSKIINTLKYYIQNKLMFSEKNDYLSLGIPFKEFPGIRPKA